MPKPKLNKISVTASFAPKHAQLKPWNKAFTAVTKTEQLLILHESTFESEVNYQESVLSSRFMPWAYKNFDSCFLSTRNIILMATISLEMFIYCLVTKII